MHVALPTVDVTRVDHARRVALAATSLAALAAVAASAELAASGAPSDDAAVLAVSRGAITGVPLAAGLYAWYRRIYPRFGVLLLTAGAGWTVTTLAETDDELLYSVGRATGWLMEVLLVYLVLAFPSGWLTTATDRRLVAAMGLAVLLLFVPRLAVAERFDVPSPFTSCVDDCPPNAFFALDQQPGFADALLRPAGAMAVAAVAAGTVLQLYRRRASATAHARRVLTPAVVVGGSLVALLGAGPLARLTAPHAIGVEVVSWVLAFAMPAIAVAFLVGLLRARLFAGRSLGELAVCLRSMPYGPALRRAFADALDDRSLEIVYRSSDPAAAWSDATGEPVALPSPESERSVTEVRHDGEVVAALCHDRALLADPELLAAATAMAGVVLDNQRLAAEAEAAMRALRRSRARLAASAEEERRRIERDLHDGAQQRLVALRIELGLAEDLVRADPDRAAARLHELEHAVDEALEELRSLAHGVYPAILADRGLVAAVRTAATRVRIPVHVEAGDVGRLPAESESAVYFCVLEALQNVLKHAPDARRVVVGLDADAQTLRFSVRDDGAGAPEGTIRPGAGLTNMQDRLASVGGEVRVESTPQVGTVVRGRVPRHPTQTTRASLPAPGPGCTHELRASRP